MAKWTLEQYLNAVRERIDETEDKEYYKDDELTRYLNIAILDLTYALSLKGIKSIPAPNVKILDLDTVFTSDDRMASLDKVFVGGIIQPIASVEQGVIDKLPYQYGNMLVFPDVVTSPIDFYYIKTPRTLTQTQDTTDIEERHQHVPVDLCIALAKEKDEEWGQGGEARNHYEYGKALIIAERGKKENQQDYDTVTMNYYRE